MKTILLTGAAGYIGSHTAVNFLEKGYDIIIIDNFYNSDISTLKNIEKITGISPKFYEIDIRDKFSLKKVFEENKIDTVIHFAGLKAVGESCENPFFYYENNILGSLNLFELMNDFGIRNIIFSSSATVYDSKIGKAPFNEKDIVGSTTSPYGTTKLILENILRDLYNHKNFRVINLRYFNPIGAHKSGLLGENPSGIPNNLIPYIMKVISGDIKYLQVFGDNYSTKDGSGERDYIHVLDLSEAHFKAFEYLENNIGKNIYEEINIGTGIPTSVFEIINITEIITGKKIPYKIVPKRLGDIDILYCNPERAKKLLAWNLKYTVKEAIEDQYNYFLKKLKNKLF